MKFLIEKQEPTVYNALQAVPNYVQKYGMLDAFLELFYNFHLTQEELKWIIDKSLSKNYIDEEDKKSILDYTEGLK